MKKKLFISCPMKGRTVENIKKSIDKMHKIAEILFEQKLEVIPSICGAIGKYGILKLSESIEALSEADYFIGVRYTDMYPNCNVESDVARSYGIPVVYAEMEYVMPDVLEIEREHWENTTEDYCVKPL